MGQGRGLAQLEQAAVVQEEGTPPRMERRPPRGHRRQEGGGRGVAGPEASAAYGREVPISLP